MIDLFTWSTPNGYKAAIALSELGLPFSVHPIDIGRGEQLTPAYLEINPNNKIPAIVDNDGPGGRPFPVFESGAILLYLAEKTGRLIPVHPERRWTCIQWLTFQVANVGPMFGQAHHFLAYANEKIPYAIDRYTREAKRLFRVLDKRLGQTEYLADEYSIADIATFPWIRVHKSLGIELRDYPHVARWYHAIDERPAVQRGLAIPPRSDRPMDDEAKEWLFGKKQHEQR